ncbi:MAG: biopolymer transporter ExbD [Planctomycetota bacterium]|nr:biopolymer transporter ExbD [Planctomycetota bacterium]
MRLSSQKQRQKANLELSMTSMIDVVFLLLIFFLVTTTFVKAERQLRPMIQVQEETQESSQQGFLEPAGVYVKRRGTQSIFKLGGREITTYDELLEVLQVFENKEDGSFVVVDDQVPFDMTAAAIQACREAGFTSVSYVPANESP